MGRLPKYLRGRCVQACLLSSLLVTCALLMYPQDPAAQFVREFPNKAVPWPGMSLSEVLSPCIPAGTLTLRTGGRLGNLILEYASVWSMARVYKLKPVVPQTMLRRLEDVFVNLSIPAPWRFFKVNSACSSQTNELTTDDYVGASQRMDQNVDTLDDIVLNAKRTNRMIVLDVCNILVETVVPLAAELFQEFRYRESLVRGAQDVLLTIKESMLQAEGTPQSSNTQVVFVGIHVRRTDYADQLRLLYTANDTAGVDYYRRAMRWMRSSLSRDAGREVDVAFVVASDDPDWCQQVLIPALQEGPTDGLGRLGVFWAGQGDISTPEQDLVMLSSCNHSIFAYGTFGLWSALMAGGKTVVYDITGSEGNRHIKGYTPSMQFAVHLENWIALW